NNFIENNFRYLLENWPEQTNLAIKTLGITKEKLEKIKTIIYEFSPTLSFANRANIIVSENLKKVNGVYNSLLANTKQSLEIN
ncbi:MAG: hypothetical protein ACI4PF_06705, partial [Christensenellales bacterium]